MYRATSVHGSLADSKTNENFSKILKNLEKFVKGRKKSKKVKNMKNLWKKSYFCATEGFCRACTGPIQGNERTWDFSRKSKKMKIFQKFWKIWKNLLKGEKSQKYEKSMKKVIFLCYRRLLQGLYRAYTGQRAYMGF